MLISIFMTIFLQSIKLINLIILYSALNAELFYDFYNQKYHNQLIRTISNNHSVLFAYKMKSLQSTKSSLFSQKSKSSIFCKQQPLVCPQGNISQKVCFKKSCSNPPFMCSIKQCSSCPKNHRICYVIQLNSLQENILSKRISTAALKDFIYRQIEHSIDMLSNLRDRLMAELSDQYDGWGFSEEANQIINLLKSGQVKGLESKNIFRLIQLLQQPVKDYQNMKIVQQKYKEQLIKFQKKIGENILKVQDYFKNLNKSSKSKESFQLFIKNSLFRNSKVVTNVQQTQRIIKFFQKDNIKKSKLLYRASQNQFLVKKFYQKCSNIKNTIVLFQTQFGKKIGGYTPLFWQKTLQIQNLKDESMKSFIFSLTNNDKFDLVNQQCAILRNSSYGPIFGSNKGPNLWIGDKANKNQDSGFRIDNDNYKNQKYLKNTEQQWQKLSGNKNFCKFTIKEWQVWQLTFQNQNI